MNMEELQREYNESRKDPRVHTGKIVKCPDCGVRRNQYHESWCETQKDVEEEWAYNDLGHHWRMDDTGSYHDYPCDHPEEHQQNQVKEKND